jgi:energy-coupling factor transport system permease protein
MSESFGMRALHPAVLLLYYAGGIAFGMLLFHPVILLSGWAACLVVNWHLDGGRQWRRWCLPMLPVIVVLMVVNPLVSHRGRSVWFYIGDAPITLESVAYGATLALFMLGTLTLFVSWRMVLTEHKFLFLFARWSPKFALLVMMAMGLIPRLRRRLHELMLIQRTRGVSVTEGTFAQRARSGVRLVGLLLSWSLDDALQTADAMQARGYGSGARSVYTVYRFGRRDGWTAAGLLAIFAAGFSLWWSGYGYLDIYPRLGSLALGAGDAGTLAAYVAYLLLPLIWEWRDRRAWQALNGTR